MWSRRSENNVRYKRSLVLLLPGRAPLGKRHAERHAPGVMETAPTPLSPGTCRDRLTLSRRGFLACTQDAAPTVLPVELRSFDGQLLVTVRSSADQSHLVGQVVAVSVGKHAFRYCKGWTVVARGRLGRLQTDGSYPLEIDQLDGATYPRKTQRRP
jgi:hypothetical protein